MQFFYNISTLPTSVKKQTIQIIYTSIKHLIILVKTLLFPSWILLFLQPSILQTPALSVSSSVSADTINSSPTSFILHRPPLNPFPITPSLNTTPTNTPTFTPETASNKLQPQKSSTIPLSDTEFPLTPLISHQLTNSFTPTSSSPYS